MTWKTLAPRQTTARRAFLSGALSAGLFAGPSASALAAIGKPRGLVDHHVHLNSPAIRAFLPGFCASAAKYGGCAPAITAPVTAADLLSQMDAAEVGRALLVSTGYLAESPLVDLPHAEASMMLRAANDWTVGLARTHRARLRAFVAVGARHADGADEIRRWAGDPDVAGIKIHLTNAATDLRKDEDLSTLAGTFRVAAQRRLPILIHLRTMRMDYGAPDARRFLEDVVAQSAATPIQIAHAGGWGGLDAPTFEVLGIFAEAIERDPKRFGHLLFDLAAVWDAQTPQADLARLCGLIRRIGVARFLPASDWPFSGALVAYYKTNFPRLPLRAEEWSVLLSNRAPYSG